jgi:hypothetical protein
MARWYGPKVVTKAMSDFVFEVEDLTTKKRSECHISRLMLYRDSKLEDEEEVMEHLTYQQDAYHVVDDFVKIRQGQNDIEILTKWRGCDVDDASCEPA